MPPLERYRLTPAPPPTAAGERSSGGDDGAARPVPRVDRPSKPLATVRVEPYLTQGIYADPQIVYRTGDSEYAAYPNREWALPLSSMLADITAEVVRSSGSGRVRVTGESEGGQPDVIWRGTVREFEEVNRGDQVLAAVHLEAALIRASNDSVMWQGGTRLERPVTGDSMEAVVATLSGLSTEAVVTMIREAARAVLPP
jgi:uncharacterized lipoprotein YmbA